MTLSAVLTRKHFPLLENSMLLIAVVELTCWVTRKELTNFISVAVEGSDVDSEEP
jgi:hypothetical protein